MTLFLHPLILSNKLIFKIFKEKTPFAPIQPQAAYALACRRFSKEGANKQVISSQADSLIKISRIWAD
ncbi:hypothetical protein, partial [Klebsiella pneumoniae]|uniref:hypothetical protein n=1 Tax=Klebsiella pneumoniae TaxID=573 RepID=UPI0034DE5034